MSAMPTPPPAPSLFVAHASPMLALERDGHAEALRAFGRRFPDPGQVDGLVPLGQQPQVTGEGSDQCLVRRDSHAG